MIEWCSEKWLFNQLSFEQAIYCQILHTVSVWYINLCSWRSVDVWKSDEGDGGWGKRREKKERKKGLSSPPPLPLHPPCPLLIFFASLPGQLGQDGGGSFIIQPTILDHKLRRLCDISLVRDWKRKLKLITLRSERVNIKKKTAVWNL